MHAVTILTFNEPGHAEPLCARLADAGILAKIRDQRALQTFWFMSESYAGIHLCVDRADYERAMTLLAEWDAAEHALEHAVHCPECRSSEVEYPQFTRKFVSPSIYALLCKVGLLEKKFYCTRCHFTWPARERILPKTDLLGWPEKAKESLPTPGIAAAPRQP